MWVVCTSYDRTQLLLGIHFLFAYLKCSVIPFDDTATILNKSQQTKYKHAKDEKQNSGNYSTENHF